MIEEATSSKHSGTTDAPLVSVVAPCFNAEKYLEEALRSIYEQDYPNFEVIIVDDGSTDNSYAMLEQLQKVGIRKRLLIRCCRSASTFQF
ncbi:glycosyltransferase family 2 protein [Pseudomonas aeruginosa]|uniref:glycosyltransferase family 2 protein n=1 Tax=Pseudomonas aeruginosa TaxID=287 RepID=UPI0023AFBA14|nr:glycosyltransferase [Pseudomonas aeruginosa]